MGLCVLPSGVTGMTRHLLTFTPLFQEQYLLVVEARVLILCLFLKRMPSAAERTVFAHRSSGFLGSGCIIYQLWASPDLCVQSILSVKRAAVKL